MARQISAPASPVKIEKPHARFRARLDRVMQQQGLHRDALNVAPLRQEDWRY
jgi:hypothetical protein